MFEFLEYLAKGLPPSKRENSRLATGVVKKGRKKSVNPRSKTAVQKAKDLKTSNP